jgi:molybdate transport system substrate-binding protein
MRLTPRPHGKARLVRWGWLAGFGLLVLPMFAASDSARADAVVTVSAAISLTDALESVAREFARAGGGAVRFNFAGSNVLSRQIVTGAPIDLFISADEAQMDVAGRAGAIDESTRIALLGNALAIVCAPAGPAIDNVRSLLNENVRRVAIGDPDAVPAGVYARLYLQRLGLWEPLRPKLVPVANVRGALTAVENGAADAAITYRTDAVGAKGVRVAVVISGDGAPRIVYPAAILARAPNRAGAARFLEFLRGAAASAIFASYKFVPLAR